MAEIRSTLSVADTSGNTTAGGAWYTTMTTWQAGQMKAIGVGDTEVLECYSDFGPSGLADDVDLTGWTTSAANNITIKAAAGNEHNGVVDAGFVMIGPNINTLNIQQDGTVVQDIQTNQAVTSGTPTAIRCINALDVLIQRCIHIRTGTADGPVAAFGPQVTGTMRNCVILQGTDVAATGLLANTALGVLVENCALINTSTVVPGLGVGMAGAQAIVTTAKNVVSAGFGTDWNVAFEASSTNNASSDLTADGANPVTGVDYTTTGVDFVDPSTLDFTATIAGRLAFAAVDLSAEFLDDITGTLR